MTEKTHNMQALYGPAQNMQTRLIIRLDDKWSVTSGQRRPAGQQIVPPSSNRIFATSASATSVTSYLNVLRTLAKYCNLPSGCFGRSNTLRQNIDKLHFLWLNYDKTIQHTSHQLRNIITRTCRPKVPLDAILLLFTKSHHAFVHIV